MIAYHEGGLRCDATSLEEIAHAVGTPCYVYSANSIVAAYRAYDGAFGDLPHHVCYAVKANSNLAVLALLAREGAGFDIVSGGELFRVLRAGGDASKVVFSGVGKQRDEIEYALEHNIHSFNCESHAELTLLNEVAGRMGKQPCIALRVNPDVDAATHPYISTGLRDHKFGIDIERAEQEYDYARSLPHLRVESVSCHIGSQLLDDAPVLEAVAKVLLLVERLRSRGHAIRSIDLGGGLGIAYTQGDQPPDIASVIGKICDMVRGKDLAIMIEPGRSIVGPAGVLLAQVLLRKSSPTKEFVVVDAAMNDLIRPALYSAQHQILPLRETTDRSLIADVVGPVCETGDFLARDRALPPLSSGDYVALQTAGAYGFAQSSNYNSRRRAAEVLVEGNTWRVVRKREQFEDLIRGETV